MYKIYYFFSKFNCDHIHPVIKMFAQYVILLQRVCSILGILKIWCNGSFIFCQNFLNSKNHNNSNPYNSVYFGYKLLIFG